MLKIVLVEDAGGAVVLKLEGKVIGPWVDELQWSCDRALAGGAVLTLDLSEVSFVDRDGVRLLRGLARRGALLQNGSVFVGEQLRAEEPR